MGNGEIFGKNGSERESERLLEKICAVMGMHVNFHKKIMREDDNV
jgi:hypothetical protein